MSASKLESPGILQHATPLRPTFFRALRGVWLLTWKSRVTWPRLSMGGLALLGLPLLVYLTTNSPEAWAQNHRLQMGDPGVYLGNFFRRASRAGVPVPAEQKAQLVRIVSDEFKRTEKEWDVGASSEPTAERRHELSEECHERILARVKPLLNERQFSEFQSAQRRHRNQRAAPMSDLVWGRTTPFYHCLIDLYFFIILPLQCVRMCGALIRDELEANTLTFLTTRPLSRARLLVVKFLSETAWLQLWLLAQTLLLLAAGAFRSIPDLGALIPLLLGAQFLAVLAWSALGLLLGQISKRYMALALLYGSIVEMGIGRIPTNINTLSLMRHLKTLLSHNPALQNIFNWPTAGVSASISALVVAAMVFLIFASLLFTFLEYHHTTEMQK